MPLKRLSLKRSRPKTANVQPDLPSKKVRAPRDGVAVVFPIDEGDLPADNFFGVHPQSDSRSAENFKVPSFFFWLTLEVSFILLRNTAEQYDSFLLSSSY